MSKVLSAKEVAEKALQAGRAYPTSESAAPAEMLVRATEWLDLVVAEEAGSGELFFFQPATLSIELTNGVAEYDLHQALGADLPVDKVQFPVDAWLEDEDGTRHPITIATFETFEAVSNANKSGLPTMIHIDRLPTTPTLRIRPYPAEDDPGTYTLKLKVQTYAPNVAPGGVTGSVPSPSVLTGMRQAWQLWLIWTLASVLFIGPIRKLPKTDIDEFKARAATAKQKLLAFENREHDTEPPVGNAWGD